MNSKDFSLLIERYFGRYSKFKKIPDWCLYLDHTHIIELFKGWAFGDGGYKNDCFQVTTISQELFFKMKIMLMKLDIQSCVHKSQTIKNNIVFYLKIYGKELQILREKMGFIPSINRGIKNNKYFFSDGNFVYHQIKSIQKCRYRGPVYDLIIGKDRDCVVNYALCS